MVRYEDGVAVEQFNHYYKASVKIQHSAKKIHGLTPEELERHGARSWTKSASERLANYLNQHPDLPIVAHNVAYDRDKVLKSAFARVENLDGLPKAGRWRCTMELSERLPNSYIKNLDAVLQDCGFDSRDWDSIHDAVIDAQCCAKIYMHLI